MKRWVMPLLVLSFILWILPLGSFIKTSAEKLACDGQRAICMCHALIVKSVDKSMEAGLALKAGASTNKENLSGTSSYFVSSKPVHVLNLASTSFFAHQYSCYKSPFLSALEYVPKV